MTTNLLANSATSPGETTTITGFTLPGISTVYKPSTSPITVKDANGVVTGTIVVLSNGTATFTPSPGYSGDVPPITYTVKDSSGDVNQSVLEISVSPTGKAHARICNDV